MLQNRRPGGFRGGARRGYRGGFRNRNRGFRRTTSQGENGNPDGASEHQNDNGNGGDLQQRPQRRPFRRGPPRPRNIFLYLKLVL